MVAIKQFIGSGFYTVREAALYARVPTSIMNRWLFGTTAGEAVIDPQFGTSDKVVSFLDLVQTLAIREIRIQREVPLPKFRQAIQVAKDSFGIDYPFARRHSTYLLGDEIVIRLPGSPDGEDEYVQISGKKKRQRLFSFVEMYLDDLSYSPDGLANKYHIYTSKHANPVRVTMDPEQRFGEPLLPSGYTAMTIWESIAVEGSIESVERVYGIPREEVETAYRFVVNHLGKAGP